MTSCSWVNRNQEPSNKEKNSYSFTRVLPKYAFWRENARSLLAGHPWYIDYVWLLSVGDECRMNVKGCERDWSWTILKCYFGVCLMGIREHEKFESGYLRFGQRSEPGVSCVRSRVITPSIMVINEHIISAGWLAYWEQNCCDDSPRHLSQARFVISKPSKMIQQQHWSRIFGGTHLEFWLVYRLFLLRISSFSSVPPPTKLIFLQCHDHLPLSPHLFISTLRCICRIAKHDY